MVTVKQYFFLAIITLMGIFKVEASDFRIAIKKQKDSIQYFIVNQTQETIKAGAIICNWYHQNDSMVFWPADMYAGFGVSASKGSYFVNNVKFDFRTSQRISFDFNIGPGDSQVFITVQNFSVLQNQVMCANVQLFYLDVNKEPKDASVFLDEEVCPFKQVYLVTNLSSDGIRFWGPSNQTLHTTSQCNSGFFAVVINRNTLEPTPVGNLIPNCSDGRKWKTFGHPKNEQVFYHFDFNDTQHIQGFVDFVDAVSPGDHVFFINAKRDPLYFTDKRVIKAFESLGAYTDMRGNYPYISKVFGAYGNKRSDSGTLEWYNDKVIRKEYFLLPNQVYDSSKSFSPCYQKTIQEIDEAQEIIEDPNDLNQQTIARQVEILVFPNPTQSDVQVFSPRQLKNICLKSINGGILHVPISIQLHKANVDLKDLLPGLYILEIEGKSFKIMKTD